MNGFKKNGRRVIVELTFL